MLFRGGPHSIADGRLTLETGVPVSVTDQLNQTSVFYTPHVGNQIALWNGQEWDVHQFTEITQSLAGLTADTPYDIFIETSGGALNIQELAWASATARTFAISKQDGIYVQDTSKTRRYVGTIYIDPTGGECNDSLAFRHVWNYYHRLWRPMRVAPTDDTWAYSTATIRQANAAAANQLDFVIGVAEDPVWARVNAHYSNLTSGSSGRVGIGLDSTSAFVAGSEIGWFSGSTTQVGMLVGEYEDHIAIGRHFLSWNEWAESGTGTFYGDLLDSVAIQSMIKGRIRA